MTIGPIGLVLLIWGSMCFGAVLGMAIMAMCRISAEDRIEGYQPDGGEFDTSSPPQGGGRVQEVKI